MKFCPTVSWCVESTGAKFHPHRCNVSPLRTVKPPNHPLSILNTGVCLARVLSTKTKHRQSRDYLCWNLLVGSVSESYLGDHHKPEVPPEVTPLLDATTTTPRPRLASERRRQCCTIMKLLSTAFISLTSSHLISTHLVSSELSASWVVAATANWVASQISRPHGPREATQGESHAVHGPVGRGCDQSERTQFGQNEVSWYVGQTKWDEIWTLHVLCRVVSQLFLSMLASLSTLE